MIDNLEKQHDKPIKVDVSIDADIFMRFALFDGFRVKKIWKTPMIFAVIMSFFAVICFVLRERDSQAVMLSVVLLTIGMGLPIVYFSNFLSSIRKQIKLLGLKQPRSVYSVELSGEAEGIYVSNHGQELARYQWSQLFGAFQDKGCVYLYVDKNKAFLLPNGQGNSSDIWSVISTRIPHERCHIMNG